MVGPRVYHLKHARSYPAFSVQDTATIMDLATKWLNRHDFYITRKNRQYALGKKRGVHVNFVPKFKLYIEQGTNGQYVVRFDYYAKIKLGTAVVVGVLTSGISTVVGVGTLAVQLADADHFVAKFWAHIDSLARGAPVILTVERWVSDGKGNFTKQPAPAGPVAPPSQMQQPGYPSYPPPNHHSHQQQQAHSSYPPPPTQYAPQMGYSPYGQAMHHQMPANGQYMGAPTHQQAPMYQQPPMHHQQSPMHHQQQPMYQQQQPMYQQAPPQQQYYPPAPPPVPQQTAPPTIQPGQVFGHNALRPTQSLQHSIPPVISPPPIHAQRHNESASSTTSSGYPTSSHHSSYPPTASSSLYPTSNNLPQPSNNNNNYAPTDISSQHSQSFTSQHDRTAPIASQASNPTTAPPLNSAPNYYPVLPNAAQSIASAPLGSQLNNAPLSSTQRNGTPSTPLGSQLNNAPQYSAAPTPAPAPVPVPAPVMSSQTNRPASPVASLLNAAAPAPLTSLNRPPSPSVRSYVGAPASTGYPSPPSVHGYRPSAPPAVSYPLAPSVMDDAASERPRLVVPSKIGPHSALVNELADRQAAMSLGDKASYSGEQQATKAVNRMSQYDIQTTFPAGDTKSFVDPTSSLHDFNYVAADTQSLRKSGETYNPWDSHTIEATRNASLVSNGGIAKH